MVGMSMPPLSGFTLQTLSMRLHYVNQLNVFRPQDLSTGSTRRTREMMLVANQRTCHIAGAPDQITVYRG
jgi:hypothetical protein